MKLRFWLVLSFIVHFALAFYFVKSQGTGADKTDAAYLDLTVLPSGALSSTPTKKVKVTAAAPVASALAPVQASEKTTTQTSAVDPSVPTNLENADTTPGGGDSEGSGDALSWGEVTRLPKVKKEVKALYPEEGKLARIDGPVVLEVLINKTGKVQSVKLIRGQGHGLDEAAIEALRGFEFQPAFKGNEPVAVKIHYTYRFKLGIN